MPYLTRAQLHDLVWSKELLKVANELGADIRTIKSACDQYAIPMPPPHYWRMVANGSPATRRQLVPAGFSRRTLVCLSEHEPMAEDQADRVTPPPTAIAVAESAADFSLRAIQARIQARFDGKDRANLISFREGPLEVFVSSNQTRRVAALISRLVAEAKDVNWTFAPSDRNKPGVDVNGDLVELRLVEKLEYVLHTPSSEEAARRRRSSYFATVQSFAGRPAGKLRFSIGNYMTAGVRKNWSDGKRQTLEDSLPKIIEGIAAYAAALRDRRLEMEESRRRWDEQRRLADERQRFETIERIRGAIFREQAAAHAEAVRLRRFVEEVRARNCGQSSTAVEEWIAWAEAHLAALDPLQGSLPTMVSGEEALRRQWHYDDR